MFSENIKHCLPCTCICHFIFSIDFLFYRSCFTLLFLCKIILIKRKFTVQILLWNFAFPSFPLFLSFSVWMAESLCRENEKWRPISMHICKPSLTWPHRTTVHSRMDSPSEKPCPSIRTESDGQTCPVGHLNWNIDLKSFSWNVRLHLFGRMDGCTDNKMSDWELYTEPNQTELNWTGLSRTRRAYLELEKFAWK